MKGLILVLIVLLYIIYYSYNIVSSKVETKLIYVIGVYKNASNDKKIANTITRLMEERNMDMIVKLYDNYFDLIEELNSFKIDFAIVPEDYYMDSFLGLNVFKNNKYENNRFMMGAYFNNFYMISDIFYMDNTKESIMTNFSDILNFKKINNRNFIIGTEENDSNSFLSLVLVLKMYDMELIYFDKYDKDKEYNDNVVFIINENKEKLYNRYLNKKLDGIFLLDIDFSRFVSTILKKTNAKLLNLDLEKTVFDNLLSNVYFKKKISINSFYTTRLHDNFSKDNITPKNKVSYYDKDDMDIVHLEVVDKNKELNEILTNLGSFNSRMIRYILITNTSIENEKIYNVTNTLIRNNNYLINKSLFNKFSNVEHNLFEPANIIYLDSNLPYHEGSKKLYLEMKFITYNRKDIKDAGADADEKYDYYWKYSKIGLKQFKFDD